MTDPPYDTSDLTPAQAEAAFLVDASPGPNGVTPWTEETAAALEQIIESYEQLRRERDALAYALEKIAQGTWNVGRERGDVDVRKFARDSLAATAELADVLAMEGRA